MIPNGKIDNILDNIFLYGPPERTDEVKEKIPTFESLKPKNKIQKRNDWNDRATRIK
jgi:hypothetical protein